MKRSERKGMDAERTKGQIAKQRMYVKLIVLLLVFGAIIAGGLYFLSGGQSGANKDMARLRGRWQRPDGGYIVDIRDIDINGHLEAAYFNPTPIHVSKAEVFQEAGTIKVFIELRDVNYPGATYNLTYDPETDQLRGVYFQPALQQSFDVVFLRMK